MISGAIRSAFLVLTIATAATAQEAPVNPSPEAAPESAAETPSFDPQPMLAAMIDLRSAALTCEPFVANSPQTRTGGIVSYFETLNQPLPDLTDTETQASLRRFIGSQAAMLCSDMLTEAFAKYNEQAAIYEQGRPREWPAAPAVEETRWCAVNFCLDR